MTEQPAEQPTEQVPRPTAEGLERDVTAAVRGTAGEEMSDEAAASLTLAMAVTAASIRMGELTEQIRKASVAFALR